MGATADAPDLRASDAERETAATEIREHYAVGRLTEDELDRIEAELAGRRHDRDAVRHDRRRRRRGRSC